MPEDYVHRIGRTGRAGEQGFAVSFVTRESRRTMSDIEKLIGKNVPLHGAETYELDMTVLEKGKKGAPKKGGYKGNKGSGRPAGAKRSDKRGGENATSSAVRTAAPRAAGQPPRARQARRGQAILRRRRQARRPAQQQHGYAKRRLEMSERRRREAAPDAKRRQAESRRRRPRAGRRLRLQQVREQRRRRPRPERARSARRISGRYTASAIIRKSPASPASKLAAHRFKMRGASSFPEREPLA